MTKLNSDAAHLLSWQDKLVDRILGPNWKNTYFRLFLVSEILLNIDSIVLLTSNYRLHSALTSDLMNGHRLFPFAFLIDRHPICKVGISMLVPAVILAVYYLAAKATLEFNKKMSAVDKATSSIVAIKSLRSEVAMLKSRLDRNKNERNSLEGVYHDSFRIAADLHAYISQRNKDFKEDFSEWYKEYIKNANRFESSLKDHVGEKNFKVLVGPYAAHQRGTAATLMHGDSEEDQNTDDVDDYQQEMMEEEVSNQALAIDRGERNPLIEP
jgi:hypothetical protein